MNNIPAIATEQVEGLHLRCINEIYYFDPEVRLRGRYVGIVLKVIKDDKYMSFVICDGSATAQVSLSFKKIQYEVDLPTIGDSVHVVGLGFKKILGANKNSCSFLKIQGLSISRITLQEEIQLSVEAAKGRRLRQKQRTIENPYNNNSKKGQLNQCNSIEVRTLIMIYCYYVFEHNSDINTYIFNQEMIRSSRDGKQFMQNFGLSKYGLQLLLKNTLDQLVQAGIFGYKKVTDSSSKDVFYIIKKQLIKGIQLNFEDKIMKEGQKGIQIKQLTSYVNQKVGEYSKTNLSLFDWKFSQRVLSKLQSLNKIYKTPDKLIFPNNS